MKLSEIHILEIKTYSYEEGDRIIDRIDGQISGQRFTRDSVTLLKDYNVETRLFNFNLALQSFSKMVHKWVSESTDFPDGDKINERRLI